MTIYTDIELKAILKAVKEKAFIKPETATDEEALGMLVAQYFKWDILKVAKTAFYAFEDANMVETADVMDKIIKRLTK